MSTDQLPRRRSRVRRLAASMLAFASITGFAVLTGAPFPATVMSPTVTHAQDDGIAPTNVIPPEYAARVPSTIRRNLIDLAGASSIVSARALLATRMGGKEIAVGDQSRPNTPKKLLDVPIGVHPTKHENEPTVAVNPADKKTLVAGSHFAGPPAPTANRCVAYRSGDGGQSWSAPFLMPHLHPLSTCSDPVVAYAPDGSRVYYSYMDIKQIFVDPPGPAPAILTIDFDIVISYSDDDGATWSRPINALDGLDTIVVFNPPPEPPTVIPGFAYDKNWHGTHIDASESDWVYLTATRFEDRPPGACSIAFTRSSDRGVSWGAPVLLDSSVGTCGAGTNPVVQGSRPSGGLNGDVLVAYFHSGTDGWLEGGMQIRTRYSADSGASFAPPVIASADSFELPFWLGPNAFYHRWWGGMFPDVEIDPDGEAHIVYTHDPVANVNGVSSTPEDGDIRYVTSGGPPYAAGSWTAAETINDDGLERAQGYAALETAHGGQSSHLHVIWEDHRLSPEVPIEFPNSPNLYFDIFYSRRTPGQSGWRPNTRVTEQSSINDFIFIGDYNDLTVGNFVFAIFTDRRHRTSIFDLEDNVFGSLLMPNR
jgi:hypothetical protein